MFNSAKSDTFSFVKLLEEIKNHVWTIILFSIIGLFLSLIFSVFFLTPKYSSTVDLLVNQKSDDTAAQYNIQQADLQAINTYKDVLKKPVVLIPVLKQARRNNNYKGSIEDLASEIKIDNQASSKVISVTVTNENAYTASDIVNSLSDIFTKKIKKIMKVNNVVIVTKGQVDQKPVFPNKKLNTIIGLILGLIVGIAYISIKFIFDKTVKDSDFLSEELGMVNLGKIYHIDKTESSFQVVESFNDQKSNKSVSKEIPSRHRV